MTLEDDAKRALKAAYDEVCTTLIDEELLEMSCFRNIPDHFEKLFIRNRLAREQPQLTPAEIEARVGDEYQQTYSAREEKLNQFVITEEVRALRTYRKKAARHEPLTPQDEEYILALMRKVRAEQSRPGYEYYSPPKYHDADGNLISFEKYVLLKILAYIDQMQREGAPEQ